MRLIRRVLAGLLTAVLLLLNAGVYRAPVIGSKGEERELLAQLRFLETSVHDGLADRMQQLFPEGRAFTYSLYGLSWCGVAARSSEAGVHTHAIKEAEWAYGRLSEAEVQAGFEGVHAPEYGAFYAGWRALLLARIVEMKGDGAGSELLMQFEAQNEELVRAYTSSSSPYLASYAGMAWPADNVVAMASIALHQRIRGTGHAVIDRWVQQVRARLDSKGAIPHAWDLDADGPMQPARGSSQSLMNCLLPLIDPALAKEQFEQYRDRFIDSRLGVPMVREYPKGEYGSGDVDSGPVILGVGFSATIVGPGACRMNGDPCEAHELDGTIESFGVPLGADKHYVFGVMPIADLFITWTRSMGPSASACSASPSYLAFHLWSLVVVAILWMPVLISVWKRRQSEQAA